MKLINQNPYRVLGVMANAPTKARVANIAKLRAFSKVGKSAPMSTDLPQLFPKMIRDEASIVEAEKELTLPTDQLWHAMWWFVATNSLDEVAIRHLQAGDMEKAKEIWSRKSTISSLHNLVLCGMLTKDHVYALSKAQLLYGDTKQMQGFITLILGETAHVDVEELGLKWLDAVCEEWGTDKVLPYLRNSSWCTHLQGREVEVLIGKIESEIAKAAAVEGHNAKSHYIAAETLMNNTKEELSRLEELLGKTDMRYHLLADRLSETILSQSIDFYNESDVPEYSRKVLPLSKYALEIAVGAKMKKRCHDNVEILERIIARLAPRKHKESTTPYKTKAELRREKRKREQRVDYDSLEGLPVDVKKFLGPFAWIAIPALFLLYVLEGENTMSLLIRLINRGFLDCSFTEYLSLGGVALGSLYFFFMILMSVWDSRIDVALSFRVFFFDLIFSSWVISLAYLPFGLVFQLVFNLFSGSPWNDNLIQASVSMSLYVVYPNVFAILVGYVAIVFWKCIKHLLK